MKVYIATCKTNDPEQESVLGEYAVEILGVFSTRKLAVNSFTLQETKTDSNGKPWIHKHICYRGEHEIEEFEIDKF